MRPKANAEKFRAPLTAFCLKRNFSLWSVIAAFQTRDAKVLLWHDVTFDQAAESKTFRSKKKTKFILEYEPSTVQIAASALKETKNSPDK